ncbi:PP2C family protein-serine/threonine phosphatase [Actinomadura sp. NPDC047616]|uniref:PP2C family protein-serine/threonine phosphatase n=1 Tax=Actinomadura sp. NPDC047616 TaxID=3155914 RepID=UPI003405E2BB
MNGGASADLSVGERVLAEVLRVARVQPPAQLADVIMEHAQPLGVRRAVVYLADLQETVLVPLPSHADVVADISDEVDVRDPGAIVADRGVVRIEGTVAGLAYRKLTVVTAEDSDTPGEVTLVDEPVRQHRVWLPLLDGTARLGVLELVLEHLDEQVLQRCHLLAGMVGLLVASYGVHSDAFDQVRRREPMHLSAEMVWAFMPGQTYATEDVVISAAAEPVYRLGGDAYDFSSMDHTVHLSLFDAAGHDLVAGLVAAVGLASCRSTRRAGGGLTDIALLADTAIREHSPEWRFMTGLLINLHTGTGRLEWVNCGHPPPLLIRRNRVVKELPGAPDPPMGLLEGARPRVRCETLQPGDRLLCYTDGVTEARTPEGEQFGVDRLADTIIRTTAAGMSAPEALRRLIHGLFSEQRGGSLSDDATVLLTEWRPTIPTGSVHNSFQTLPNSTSNHAE